MFGKKQNVIISSVALALKPDLIHSCNADLSLTIYILC